MHLARGSEPSVVCVQPILSPPSPIASHLSPPHLTSLTPLPSPSTPLVVWSLSVPSHQSRPGAIPAFWNIACSILADAKRGRRSWGDASCEGASSSVSGGSPGAKNKIELSVSLLPRHPSSVAKTPEKKVGGSLPRRGGRDGHQPPWWYPVVPKWWLVGGRFPGTGCVSCCRALP